MYSLQARASLEYLHKAAVAVAESLGFEKAIYPSNALARCALYMYRHARASADYDKGILSRFSFLPSGVESMLYMYTLRIRCACVCYRYAYICIYRGRRPGGQFSSFCSGLCVYVCGGCAIRDCMCESSR